jgi:hypothetical protein
MVVVVQPKTRENCNRSLFYRTFSLPETLVKHAGEGSDKLWIIWQVSGGC